MMHFKFGQDRLAEPHALKAFELAQRSIEALLGRTFNVHYVHDRHL